MCESAISYYCHTQPHDVEDEHRCDAERELEDYIATERVCNKKFDLLKFWKVHPFLLLAAYALYLSIK